MSAALSNMFVVFHLGDEEYALPVSDVSSIIRYEAATSVPRSPDAVMGVINLRGRVIPVVDLLMRFRAISFTPGPFSRIVVCEGAAGPVGIAVDSATEVVEFPADWIRPVPDGVLAPDTSKAFAGVVERDGALVILLELNEAVPSAEYSRTLADASKEGDSDA